MKTILQIKKLLLIPLLFLVGSFCMGQTWSSSPSLNTWTSVGNNSTFTCSFGQVTRYEVQARVTNLNSSTFTVQFRKMNSGTFGSAGTAVIVDNTECNTFPIPGGGTLPYAANSTGATFTSATHSVTPGTSKTFYVRVKPSTTNWFITLPITISATQVPQPNLVCGSYSVSPNPLVQGQNANFSYGISNTGNGNYTGSLRMMWRNATQGFQLGNTKNGLNAGTSHTFTASSTPLTSTPGNWTLSIEEANGNPKCSRNYTVVAAQPNLSAGNASLSPNPIIQGSTPTTFQNTITNTGSGAFSGTVYLSLHSSTGAYISDIVSPNVNISAGGSYTLVRPSNPINTAPGNYRIVTKYQNSSGGFVELNSTNYTITAPTYCVQGSGNPPVVGSPEWNATQYLCENGIIQNQQNWSDNFNQAILRQDIAKIAYLGLYKGNTPNSPAFNFPVPFNDMQSLNAGNTYWYDAVKTLAYLQYSDDKTAFDRDFINFNPTQPIKRKYAIKMFLEAFDIAPNTSGTNPFSDVSTSDEMYGYIKKAYDLGIVTGSGCTSPNICFFPENDITRQDAFIILHRILTFNIQRPTYSQLTNRNNYFIPGNNRFATFGKVPGLDQANFNHYQKTSFSIAGRGIPLDFTHTYNSFLTELPKGFFEDINSTNADRQKFTPLGIGWTHTYNIYAVKVDGYTIGSHTEPAKIMFYYPDGSINIYDYATLQPDVNSIGNYDIVSRVSTSDGEKITVSTKGQMKYVFENRNYGKHYFIQNIKDRNGNGVKMTWNQQPTFYKLTKVEEIFSNGSTGRSLSFNYEFNLSQKLKSVTDNSLGRTIEFNVDTNWDLLSFKDPKGQITSYNYESITNYNTSHLLKEIILPKGNKIRNTYVNRKLISSQTLSQANVATSTTNVNWTPNYSSSGYNSSATITDPQERESDYIHNTLGNPTQIVTPTGTTTFNGYGSGNNANLPTNLTVNGQSSSISYDTKGNVLNITKNGITNSFTYTTFNDVLTHTDGRGFTTNYSYDGVGNLTSVQRPSGGGSTTISRNSFGQVQSVTNPSGITTQFGYNTNGLTNQISMPLGITTSSTYDNASRLLSTTDANGKVTSFQYDPNDNLTQSTDANNQPVLHTYDANDNHLTIKNPKNETQTNNYNFDDDLLASEVFGSHTKSYTYNADGSLATHTRGNGTFTYSYDNTTGRLTSDGHTSYAYDTRGNITSITNSNGTLTLNYDNNDRMTSYSDYYGNTVSYLYDNNNNVTRITYPGNKQVNYIYDANNRCTSVTDWNNKVTSYTYLADDRVSKITLPNGTFTDYTYDSAGRMTSIINKKANGTVITSYAFTMDNAGNHLTETITEPSITAGLQTVANETINHGQYPFNRIQSQGSTSFTHNTAGGITQAGSNSFSYDINDNMLTAPNSSFSYDGAGNRRAKTVSGANTRYVLSILGMSQVLMETNSSNVVQNYYVYGPTGLLYRVKADNATYSYYHYDYRGSTTAITNEAQNITHSYSYDPFGKVLAKTEADANPFQYVGKYGVQYESPTLTFMRARYYDPTTGRFVSEDPIWHLNLYPYADNNPINYIDYDGNLKKRISGSGNEQLRSRLKNITNKDLSVRINNIINNKENNFSLDIQSMINKYSKNENNKHIINIYSSPYHTDGKYSDPILKAKTLSIFGNKQQMEESRIYLNYIDMLEFKEKNRSNLNNSKVKAEFFKKFYYQFSEYEWLNSIYEYSL